MSKNFRKYLNQFVFLSVLFSLYFLNSCYVSKGTSSTKKGYAILKFNSYDKIRNNFTQYNSGLKVTYDFWGATLLVILENISDSTLYINLNSSKTSNDYEKLTYNDMISGDFSVLPLLPDSIIELQSFYIFNPLNLNRLKPKIKELKHFVYKQKFFKKGEYPVILSNEIHFSIKQFGKEFKKDIKASFYSEQLILKTDSEFTAFQQDNNELYKYSFIDINELP